MRAFFLIALAIAPITALADFIGRVVKVSDGDTLTILDAANLQHKVRLRGRSHVRFVSGVPDAISDLKLIKSA